MFSLEDVNKIIDDLENAANDVATAHFVGGIVIGFIAGLVVAALLQ